MEGRRKIKRTWILSIVTVIIGYILLEIFLGFFVRDLYADFRERQVQKEITNNYNNNKDAFQKLIEYAQDLPLKEEVAFLSKNKFQANFSGHNYHPFILNNPDSTFQHYEFYRDSMNLSFEDWQKEFGMIDWDILPNRLGKVVYEDTTYYSYQWHWEFEGGINHKDFQKFLTLTNLEKQQLIKLQNLVKVINGTAIKIYGDKSIQIRFAGSSFHHFSYFINFDSKYFTLNNQPYMNQGAMLIYDNLHQINDNIHIGSYKSPMFCGRIIF